jgi:hypothetical protein
MTTRTSSRTVVFTRSFSLPGVEAVQPPGAYTVETDEELLEDLSFQAYRRTATTIRLPSPSGKTWLDQMVLVDPLDLEAAQDRDRVEPAPREDRKS